MRYVALIFVLMFAAVSFCSAADNLGELAKKEKERREALAKKGKKGKTFTNADIKNLKSTLALEVKQDPNAAQETGTASSTSSPSAASTSTTSDATEASSTETAGADQTANNSQLQQLQQEKAELEAQIQQNRQRLNDSGLLHSRGSGNLFKEIREAEARLQEIDKQIQERQQKQQQQQPPPENPQ